MMEEIKEKIFDKKAEGWKFEDKNFVAENELTVVITLDEYRELVTKVAQADFKYNELNKSKLELKEQYEVLLAEHDSLKRAFIESKITEV